MKNKRLNFFPFTYTPFYYWQKIGKEKKILSRDNKDKEIRKDRREGK